MKYKPEAPAKNPLVLRSFLDVLLGLAVTSLALQACVIGGNAIYAKPLTTE